MAAKTPAAGRGPPSSRPGRVRRPEPESPVVTFLAEIDMLQYADALLANGFDDVETLLEMEDVDMADMGMPRGHVLKFKRRLRELTGVDEERSSGKSGGAETQRPPAMPQTAPVLSAPVPDRHQAAGVAARAIADGGTSFGGSQVSAVQVSWEKVKLLGHDHVGGLLYKNLFEMNPEAIQLFPREVRARYQSWTLDEASGHGDVYNSPALSALFGKVITAVGSSVSGLQNTEALVPKLRSLGMRHIHYRGVTEAHFPVLQKALMTTLRTCLDDVFTPEVEFAWSMVYQFLAAIMCEGLREAQALEAQAKAEAAGTRFSSHSTLLGTEPDTPHSD